MKRDQILREILNEEELIKKYKMKNISEYSTSKAPHNKLVEVLSVIINENDNNLSDTQIYRKIKNIHNIG